MLYTSSLQVFAVFSVSASAMRVDTTAVLHPPESKDYANRQNRLDCPYAHKSKWTGPKGGHWGILCGWDTQSTTYYKGPIPGITFEECILRCGGANFDCNVATFTDGAEGTGTCYLKKSAKGMGYRNTGVKGYRVAIQLDEPGAGEKKAASY